MKSDWPPDVEMGKRIRAARRAAGLTGEQLAARVGVGQSMVSKIENGKTGTSSDVLQRVAGTLGVSVLHLVGRGGPQMISVLVPAERLEQYETLSEDEWPDAFRGPAPEYWPGTLRDFIGSIEAMEMRLVPDEVPLLAKAVIAVNSPPPTNNLEWKSRLSVLRFALGIKGRPIYLELEPAEDEPTDGGK